MKTREQLVKSAAKQRGPIAGVDAQRLLAHWLSNRTEIVITEAITGVLAHWSVFSEERGNGRPPKVWIPALSSVRGLSRDMLGFGKREDLESKLCGFVTPPRTMLTIEDGIAVFATVRLESHNGETQLAPAAYVTDTYSLRHARFYDWEETMHVAGRGLRMDVEPYLFQGPCEQVWLDAAWNRSAYHAGGIVKALHVRPAREARWNGRRALITLERAT